MVVEHGGLPPLDTFDDPLEVGPSEDGVDEDDLEACVLTLSVTEGVRDGPAVTVGIAANTGSGCVVLVSEEEGEVIDSYTVSLRPHTLVA